MKRVMMQVATLDVR